MIRLINAPSFLIYRARVMSQTMSGGLFGIASRFVSRGSCVRSPPNMSGIDTADDLSKAMFAGHLLLAGVHSSRLQPSPGFLAVQNVVVSVGIVHRARRKAHVRCCFVCDFPPITLPTCGCLKGGAGWRPRDGGAGHHPAGAAAHL